jgi:hypothetical protein
MISIAGLYTGFGFPMMLNTLHSKKVYGRFRQYVKNSAAGN